MNFRIPTLDTQPISHCKRFRIMPDDIISLEMSGPLAGVLHQQVKMEILVIGFKVEPR